jgi:hypothetical protein
LLFLFSYYYFFCIWPLCFKAAPLRPTKQVWKLYVGLKISKDAQNNPMDKQTIKGINLWLVSSMLNFMPVKKNVAREQNDRYFPQASDHPVGLVLDWKSITYAYRWQNIVWYSQEDIWQIHTHGFAASNGRTCRWKDCHGLVYKS